MSEQRPFVAGRRDAGMTLPELLISVVVIGMIVTVVAASITVTLRSRENTEGRLNVARAEQALATWLPGDLSSAVDYSELPGTSPCGAPSCPGVGALDGSNALMLSWPDKDGSGTTNVAYIYRLEDGGPSYELVRVECSNGSCSAITVLHDLDGPPAASFVPGVTPVPSTVVNVAAPLAAEASSDASSSEDASSVAHRIVVTINGGGSSEGTGGGVNRVSITAGGTDLDTLEPDKVTGPSFLKAVSRCGGPITIIVDDSGSISTAGASVTVEKAVAAFVEQLAGTPTKVQVVPFSNRSRVLQPTGSTRWDYYYDMTVPSDVSTLIGSGYPNYSGSKIAADLVQSGATNWEDAMYRTFYTATGERLDGDGNPATFLPGLVVFFTDGQPTINRTDGAGYYSGSVDPATQSPARMDPNKWPNSNGSNFDQEGYDRAVHLIRDYRAREDVRLIGVGVGGIATGRVYSFNDDTVLSYPYGIVYRSSGERVYAADAARVRTGAAFPNNTDRDKVLGNFIAGGDLWNNDRPYVEAELDQSTTPPTWNNTTDADLYVSDNWSALASALSAIAVGECGGTLSMQTRLPDGSVPQFDLTYESGGETVTTSAIVRAATFDITTSQAVTTTVRPQDLGTSGFVAQSWACSSKGAALDASKWSLVTPGNPADGVNVTIAPNEAISCTLTVVPA